MSAHKLVPSPLIQLALANIAKTLFFHINEVIIGNYLQKKEEHQAK
jgi:hypothetical protein